MNYSPLKIPAKNLFILLGDQRHGPFTIDELHEKFESGQVLRGTFLWYPGLLNWVTVGDIPDFDRRDVATPPPEVTEIPENKLWVYDKGNVKAIEAEALRQQIRDNNFRRADLIYIEAENRWIRSDQHPEYGAYFRPAIQPPSLDAAVAAGAELTTEAPAAAAPPAAAPAETPAAAPASPIVDLTATTEMPKPPAMAQPPAMKAPAATAEEKPKFVPKPMPMSAGAPKKAATFKTTPVPVARTAVPPSLDSKRWSWVYPGAGFASVLLVLSYAAGLWDVDLLVSWLDPGEEKLVIERVPSPNRAPSSLNAMFTLGVTLDELRGSPDFQKCRSVGNNPLAGQTYVCTGYEAALASVEMALTEERLSRVTVRFKSDAAARQMYEKMATSFGAAWSINAMPCTSLSSAQRSRYSRSCASGTLYLSLWKDDTNAAQALTERTAGREEPLEISFTTRPGR